MDKAGTHMSTHARRVIGDTPQHGKHLIWDGEHTTEVDGGLAFAVGVAVLEAELVKDLARFWQIQHPNGVAIYHVYLHDGLGVVVVNIGSTPHVTK